MVGTAIKNREAELNVFRSRIIFATLAILFAFGILAARMIYLQVIKRDQYYTMAEANRISVVPVVPNRGIIYDRNGEVLAANYSAFTLEVTPSKVKQLDKALDELASIVDIQPRDRRRLKRLLEESKNFESLPVRNRLSEEEVARFAVHRYRFPGFEIRARLFRNYPFGLVASHAIGYIGRINDADLKRIEAQGRTTNYKGTDHIGKLGIEGSYEAELHGTTGSEQVEIDAGGRAIRALAKTEPIAGNNLRLTLDIKLQKVAEEVFGEFRGALVAMDPNNGEILAFVSKPGFDPNLFVDGIDPVNWDLLNNSEDKPLNNRALRGQYPPGSTIKPFMALAALENGKRTPEYSIVDPGFWMLPGVSRPFRDWKQGGHGVVNLHKSVVVSCDTYYYGLGNDLGIDKIHAFMTPFGFGSKNGIDIDGELPGIMPSQEWKQKRFKQKWYAGDTISVSIGQGYWLATPLQLATATAILANGGIQVTPHLLKEIVNAKTGEKRAYKPPPQAQMRFKPENLQLVRQAMVDVMKPGGTAALAGAGASYLIAGKTGTAQVIGMKQGEKYDARKIDERHRDHALFVAYAPADNPKIALALLVENGGGGGGTASPMAREIFDYYLLGKLPDPAKRKKRDYDLSDGE
ncbi:MAG: penicillin-binding protein 2 [Burkholderiales bacterium]